MRHLILLIMFIFFPFSRPALGAFKDLLKEFLDTHLVLKINEQKKFKATIDRNLVRATKNRWALSASPRYRYDEGAYNAYYDSSKERSYAISISKNFTWGGQLTLGNIFTDTDNTSRSSSHLSDDLGKAPLQSYHFKQSLGLTTDLGRDLWGWQFHNSLDQAERRVRISEIMVSQSNQRELSNFYYQYLLACQRKTLLFLQRQALKRSQKRLALTRKRVADGLSERADLYSAQIEEVSKQEELVSAENLWRKSLNDLSKSLNRPVRHREVVSISPGKEKLTRPTKYDVEDNFELKKLKIQLEESKLALKSLERQYIPKISLKGTYQTDRLRSSDSMRTIREGLLGGRESEYVVELGVEIPLDYTMEKLNESRKETEIRSLEMQLSQTMKQLKLTAKTLQGEIQTQLEKLQFSRRRIELSKKSLRERARLYNIGKGDFDGVLHAEENLIRTERSYITNWFYYESAMAQRASLYAKLLATLRAGPL